MYLNIIYRDIILLYNLDPLFFFEPLRSKILIYFVALYHDNQDSLLTVIIYKDIIKKFALFETITVNSASISGSLISFVGHGKIYDISTSSRLPDISEHVTFILSTSILAGKSQTFCIGSTF